MIYFDASKPGNGTYATVWKVKQDDKGFVKCQISTNEKDKETGEFNHENWFATFGKGISENALKLEDGTRILMDRFAVKNPSVKKTDGSWVSYLNVSIFHFSVVEGNSNTSTPNTGSGFPKPQPPIKDIKDKAKPVEDEEPTGLPFDL